MKSLNKLADKLDEMAKRIDEKIVKANEKTAQKVYEDILELAPEGLTGNYKNSIKIYPTENKNSVISTFIGSDLVVSSKWGPQEEQENPSRGFSNNAPAGTRYNLGYLLEHGTAEHAIPNAFGRGFYWSFIDNNGVFHKGTLEDEWHPGSKARPHYAIALINNKETYKANIKEAWR